MGSLSRNKVLVLWYPFAEVTRFHPRLGEAIGTRSQDLSRPLALYILIASHDPRAVTPTVTKESGRKCSVIDGVVDLAMISALSTWYLSFDYNYVTSPMFCWL